MKLLLLKVFEIERELSVIEKLTAYGTSIKKIEKNFSRYTYSLLYLRPRKHTVKIEEYHANELDKATKSYLSYEKKLGTQESEQIVLVSGA